MHYVTRPHRFHVCTSWAGICPQHPLAPLTEHVPIPYLSASLSAPPCLSTTISGLIQAAASASGMASHERSPIASGVEETDCSVLKVLLKINLVTYCLANLWPMRIHPKFHVSWLKLVLQSLGGFCLSCLSPCDNSGKKKLPKMTR